MIGIVVYFTFRLPQRIPFDYFLVLVEFGCHRNIRNGVFRRSKITRDRRMDRRTDGPTDGRTRPLIEMRSRI